MGAKVEVCRAVALPFWGIQIKFGLVLYIYAKPQLTEILNLANPFNSDVRKSDTRVISQREIDVKKANIPSPKVKSPNRSEATQGEAKRRQPRPRRGSGTRMKQSFLGLYIFRFTCNKKRPKVCIFIQNSNITVII